MKKSIKKRSIKRSLCIAALCFGAAASVLFGAKAHKAAVMQRHIASEVIRFHVLANSDDRADQELKLEVRDEVLACLEGLLEGSGDVETSRARIEEHLQQIEARAEACIAREGYAYPVKAELVRTEFPEKTYGSCTFPAGPYEALRVSIGEAEGHNWWCMVYPGLCFTEESGAYVSEESRGLLEGVLTEEEFELVAGEGRVRFGLKLFGLD